LPSSSAGWVHFADVLTELRGKSFYLHEDYLEDQGEPFDSWAEWLSEMYHKEDCIRRLNPPVPPRAEMEQPGGLHDVSAIHCSLIRNAAPSAQILPLSKLVALVFGAS